jgi:dTMP kinase
LVLDLPPETGLARAGARNTSETRFENFDLAFHIKLREAFREIVQREPDRCAFIDATGTEDRVAELIWRAVAGKFKL